MTRVRLPHLLISLGLHLAVLLVLVLVKAPQLPEIRQRRVVVEFSPRREVERGRETRPETGSQTVPRRQAEILASEAEPLSGSLDLSGPRSLAVPSGLMPAVGLPTRPETSAAGRVGLPLSRARVAAVVPEADIRLSVPAAQEVLADMPAAAPTLPKQSEVVSGAGGEGASRGYLDSGALEWRGRERKVLKAARPEFPKVLLQEGQEADVEATFKVAPNGQVTFVEITRSSGYSAVDRAVERALSNYLFEASTTDDEDTGRALFRFRLERVN